MRDHKKFCLPKLVKYPTLGDIMIRLKNGETGVVTPQEYEKIKSFFLKIGEYEVLEIEEPENLSTQRDYVDLGLPSGKKWAIGNLVKDSQGNYSIGEETDWGTYVSWGNIIGHNEGEGYNFDQTTYNRTPGKQVAANIPSNDAAHDIALATLGSPWHLPTKKDYQELYDNTDSEWVADYNGTGVAGRKFMKKSDHTVYVFFPASGRYNGTTLENRGTVGFYWKASFVDSTGAHSLNFSSSYVYIQLSIPRYRGLTVRPVLDE